MRQHAPHHSEQLKPAGRNRRRGTTVVEMAVILPVFFSFLFALFEFSHAYMVISAISTASKKAARYGVAEGVSTAQVAARTREILEEPLTSIPSP